MKMPATLIAATLLPLCGPLFAQEGSSTLEASALVNLDVGGIAPLDLSQDSLPMGLGDAEFGLAWKRPSGVSANAVLAGDGGNILLDQAWGAIEKDAGKLEFGLFTLPHGINEGRLVHDPLLQEHLETILPGLAATAKLGPVSPAIAVSSREREIESEDPESEPSLRQEAVATAALDWAFGDDGLVRASTMLSTDRRDAALAATAPLGMLRLDAEVAVGAGSARAYDAGFLAGAAADLTESVQIATRLDGLLVDDEWTKAVAAGISWSPVEGGLVAAEWLQDLDGDGVLTLRLGMELDWTSSN